MKTFQEWIMNESVKKTCLKIFDFDGTVANTPLKPELGVDRRAWNGKDWWGSSASLDSPEKGGFFDGSMNQEVVDAFHAAKKEPNTLAILLTGRRSPVAHKVRNILRNNELYGRRIIDHPKEFDRYEGDLRTGKDIQHQKENDVDSHEEYYTGDHVVTNGIPGTYGHKKHVIDKLVHDNGGYEVVELWDDRKEHIDLFKACGQDYLRKGLVKKFVIHQVFPPTVEGSQAYIVDIPITLNSSWKTHG